MGMYRLISKLSVYKNLGETPHSVKLANIIYEMEYKKEHGDSRKLDKFERAKFVSEIYSVINELLMLPQGSGSTGTLAELSRLHYQSPFAITCKSWRGRDG